MEMNIAVISALVTLTVCLINNSFTRKENEKNRKLEREELEKKQDKTIALIEYKLNELTTEVREHNNFAKRMPVLEEQIKVINNRLADLEKKVFDD